MNRRYALAFVPFLAVTGCAGVQKVINGPAPQVTPQIGSQIDTAFIAAQSGLLLLASVNPTLGKEVQALLDVLQKAYKAYSATPNQTTLQDVQAAIDSAFVTIGQNQGTAAKAAQRAGVHI